MLLLARAIKHENDWLKQWWLLPSLLGIAALALAAALTYVTVRFANPETYANPDAIIYLGA